MLCCLDIFFVVLGLRELYDILCMFFWLNGVKIVIGDYSKYVELCFWWINNSCELSGKIFIGVDKIIFFWVYVRVWVVL